MPFFVVAFALAIASVPPLAWIARRIGLVDSPSNRKKHNGAIPLVGGLSIFLVAVVCLLLSGEVPSFTLLILAVVPIVVVGVADDLLGLGPWLRLVTQVAVSLVMIWYCGLQVFELGNLFGYGNVILHPFAAVVFTVFCVVGVINAINMIDGINGLAGSLVLTTLLALYSIGYLVEDTASLFIISVLGGALLAYLLFNLGMFGNERRIFLGDAGSMMLGFALVWLLIDLSQSSAANAGRGLSSVSAGWLFGLPLVDTVSVMVARLRRGHSPFRAGRDHVHHFFVDEGVSNLKTLVILVLVHAGFICVGLLVNQYRELEPYAFCGFVALVIAHHIYTPRLIARYKHVLAESPDLA